MVDRALRSTGMNDYEIALELQESTSVREAVRHGQYIAMLPQCTALGELKSGALVALDLASPLAPLQVRVVYSGDPGPSAERLIKVLRG
jgi:DNA-binding transcriptional LysR family regulator